MQPTPLTAALGAAHDTASLQTMRSGQYRPRRAIWPGLVGAAVIAAGVATVVMFQSHDDRPLASDATAIGGIERARTPTATPAHPADAEQAAGVVGAAAAKMQTEAEPDPAVARAYVSTAQVPIRIESPARSSKSRPQPEVLTPIPSRVAHVQSVPEVPAAIAVPAPEAVPAATPDVAPADQ